MITLGSVLREDAARTFTFLAEGFRGRRTAIRDLTHDAPEFVFWIYPDGRLYDARTSHKAFPPPGFEHILDDEPDYGGFLRGRVVRYGDNQLIVVYCREEALASNTRSLKQFVRGVSELPVPVDDDALVISDNADIYGTVLGLEHRARQDPQTA